MTQLRQVAAGGPDPISFRSRLRDLRRSGICVVHSSRHVFVHLLLDLSKQRVLPFRAQVQQYRAGSVGSAIEGVQGLRVWNKAL